MTFQDVTKAIKKSWNWIWSSDSIWSWVVALILIFLFIKFIFFPGLSLIQGTSLPLAGVESSSMDHQIVVDDYGRFTLCGNIYSKENIVHKNFEEYWETCGNWYEQRDITKQEFNSFSLKNGFSKGDIIIVWGRFTPKIGDVIIFKPNAESLKQTPIIHRIVKIENGIIETKGDHNEAQITLPNDYNTDETHIASSQIIGKAVFKIPYLGYIKIWASELTGKI